MRYDLLVGSQGTRVGGGRPRRPPAGPVATGTVAAAGAILPGHMFPAVNILMTVCVISTVCTIFAAGATGAAVARRGGTLNAALDEPVGSTAPARAAA